MARMIPSEIPDNAPYSEKVIFENLRSAARSRDWVVFHSEYVDNPDNPARPREIDFLIFIPEFCTVMCLEVKGGSYEVRGRQWYRMPSGGAVRTSPPEQARSAMWALLDEFETTHFSRESLLSAGCAVAFTDAEMFPRDARVPKEALIIERRASRNPESLCDTLADHADVLRPHAVRRQLDNDAGFQLGQIALADLQEELERTVVIARRPERIVRRDLENLRPQLLRLTDDQTNCLRLLRRNDRCVFDGAAGTGKTVIAMELARQRAEAGERVALLCSNPNLSARFERWTQTLTNENGGSVSAGTPASLPGLAFGDNDEQQIRHLDRLADSPNLEETLKFGYLADEWTSFVEQTVADLPEGGTFDYLIVDEAQNLCDEVFLNLMDALVVGGLDNGRWTMFGDFTYQNIVSPRFIRDGRDVLDEFGLHWAEYELETNCRNTYEIYEEIAKLTDIESPPISGVYGPLVQREYFDSEDDLTGVLDHLIGDLRRRRFKSGQIVVLSTGEAQYLNSWSEYGGFTLLNISEAEVLDDTALRDREDVTDISRDSEPSIVRYSDVYDFQGLESDVAILILRMTGNMRDLGSTVSLPDYQRLRRVLYTGMSRAKALLIIVAQDNFKDFLEPPGL